MSSIFKTDYLNTTLSAKEFYIDRGIDTVLELPYSWFDVKIKPNDIVTSRVINESFKMLYDNLLYLISKSKLPSNKIPVRDNYTNFIATTGYLSAADWYSSSELPTLSSDTSTGSLTSITNGVIFEGDTTGNYNTVLTTGTNVFILSSLPTSTINILSESSELDNYTGRSFQSIKSLTVTKS